MQRMYNLDQWSRLFEGGGLAFANPRPRPVRLQVNAPAKSALYVVDSDGVEHFLALVEGRDVIEFNSSGPFTLTVEGHEVMIFTADGDDISQKIIAPVIFTKIAERRRRNPELEHLAYIMERNLERRLAQTTAELERRFQSSAAPRPKVDKAAKPAEALPAKPESTSDNGNGGGAGGDGGAGGAAGSTDKPADKSP